MNQSNYIETNFIAAHCLHCLQQAFKFSSCPYVHIYVYTFICTYVHMSPHWLVSRREKRALVFGMKCLKHPTLKKLFPANPIVPKGPKWSELVHNDKKWFKMIQNGQKWSNMFPNCPKWFVIVQHVPSWSKIVQYVLKLSQMVPNFKIFSQKFAGII